jgi:type IX secretion system PorP/SprF family membrane protein
MSLKPFLLSVVFIGLSGIALAQQNLVYNHYFLNPYLYNPSYIAPNGYTELYLNYRKQWAGINGAPSTATLNFHLPINYKMGIGATVYQDEAGVLTTTTALLSYGYQIFLGTNTNMVHKLAFGISAGFTMSYIPLNKVENGDVPDNALSNNSTSSMDGQFGLHYELKNFRLSFAVPRLFRTYVTSTEDFNTPTIDQITSTLSSVSYNFNFGKVSFEPMVTYRTEKDFDSQLEALGVLRFNNVAWVGGSYRQDYGAAAFFGFNIKDRYKVGYAYEFAPEQVTGIGNGSHEFQLVVRLGKKKPAYAKQKPAEKPAEEVANTKEPATEEAKPEETPITEQKTEPPVVETVAAAVIVTKTKEEPEQPITQQHDLVVKEQAHQEAERLTKGHYVVVGAFTSLGNAKKYMNTLKSVGYPAAVSFIKEKAYYVVHMGNTATIEEARELRNEYRRKSRYSFGDTWVLTVE